MSQETFQDLPTKDFFTHRINNNYYYFDISIINLEGRSHTIKPTAINSLVLVDKFHNFFHSGYIIIDNMYDMIERDYVGDLSTASPSYYSSFGSSTPSKASAGFVFKGDSRDILRIDIMPSLKENQPGGMGTLNEQRLFRMYFDFAIYHSEDIEGDSPDQKLKKLYFWDLYYELMQEQNTYFSTAKYIGTTDNLHNLTDSARSVPTGKAIRDLIIETFNDQNTSITKYKANFFTANGSLGTTQATIEPDADDPNWDVGSTSVFFSAPAQYKAIDALHYLLERHVSNAENNYDLCFLRLERFPRVFTFTSLKSLFDSAYISNSDASGDYYLETVKIAGYTTVKEDGGTYIGLEFRPVPTKAVYLDKYGTLKTFNYSDMSGIFSQKDLTSRIVHSYDYDSKVFAIDSFSNDITETKSVFFNNYGSQLKSATVPNFNPGKLRNERYNVQNVFTTIGDENQRLSQGRNKSLYAGIFSNNVISFRLPGSTHRQSGTFLGIDRDGAIETSAFDNKILGIYFILEAKHIFHEGEYFNELKCVKTYYANQIDPDIAI